jgi:hypothetical protein
MFGASGSPIRADRIGAFEVGEHEDVEKLGAGSRPESIEAVSESTFEIVRSHGGNKAGADPPPYLRSPRMPGEDRYPSPSSKPFELTATERHQRRLGELEVGPKRRPPEQPPSDRSTSAARRSGHSG